MNEARAHWLKLLRIMRQNDEHGGGERAFGSIQLVEAFPGWPQKCPVAGMNPAGRRHHETSIGPVPKMSATASSRYERLTFLQFPYQAKLRGTSPSPRRPCLASHARFRWPKVDPRSGK